MKLAVSLALLSILVQVAFTAIKNDVRDCIDGFSADTYASKDYQQYFKKFGLPPGSKHLTQLKLDMVSIWTLCKVKQITRVGDAVNLLKNRALKPFYAAADEIYFNQTEKAKAYVVLKERFSFYAQKIIDEEANKPDEEI